MRRKHFGRAITVMVPDGLPAAIATAARCQCTSISEFVRRAVLEQLRKSGKPFVPEGTADGNPSHIAEVA